MSSNRVFSVSDMVLGNQLSSVQVVLGEFETPPWSLLKRWGLYVSSLFLATTQQKNNNAVSSFHPQNYMLSGCGLQPCLIRYTIYTIAQSPSTFQTFHWFLLSSYCLLAQSQAFDQGEW